MCAEWLDVFDRLERAVSALPVDDTFARTCRMAVLCGREAAKRVDVLERRESLAAMPPVIRMLRHGDRVLLGDSPGVPAVVLAVSLHGPSFEDVRYLCGWWLDGKGYESWLPALMVEAADDSAPRAAFSYGGLSNAR